MIGAEFRKNISKPDGNARIIEDFSIKCICG